MSYKVSIVIEKEEHGYYVYSSELEGCQSQGDSLEDAIANIKEAIELYLETLSEDEIDPNISLEPISGCPGKPSKRRESSVFCRKAKVSKPNASAQMTLLLETGYLTNPSLEGRGKGSVSENFLWVTTESSGCSRRSEMSVFSTGNPIPVNPNA